MTTNDNVSHNDRLRDAQTVAMIGDRLAEAMASAGCGDLKWNLVAVGTVWDHYSFLGKRTALPKKMSPAFGKLLAHLRRSLDMPGIELDVCWVGEPKFGMAEAHVYVPSVSCNIRNFWSVYWDAEKLMQPSISSGYDAECAFWKRDTGNVGCTPIENVWVPILSAIDKDGVPAVSDLGKRGGLTLIAGNDGMGKTTCLSAMLCSLALSRTEYQVQFFMIDLCGQLAPFVALPHVAGGRIATSSDEALALLELCKADMERRMQRFADAVGEFSIIGYNRKAFATDQPVEPYRIIVIDDLTSLANMCGNRGVKLVEEITCRAWKGGYSLIATTNTSNPRVFAPDIAFNAAREVCFRVSEVDAVALSGSNAASTLTRPGEIILKGQDCYRALRCGGHQSLYITQKEVRSVVCMINEKGWRTPTAISSLRERIMSEYADLLKVAMLPCAKPSASVQGKAGASHADSVHPSGAQPGFFEQAMKMVYEAEPWLYASLDYPEYNAKTVACIRSTAKCSKEEAEAFVAKEIRNRPADYLTRFRLRAFTVKPIWAWLIMSGVKDVENRWIAPVPPKGTAAVHVSSKYTRSEYEQDMAWLEQAFPGLMEMLCDDGPMTYEDIIEPCGGIIGVVDYEVKDSCDSVWWGGQYKPWMLSRPWPFIGTYIPCKGQVGMWTLPPDVNAEVLKELGKMFAKDGRH